MRELVPAGRYAAVALDAQLGMSSKGTEQIAVKFQIEGGRTITWYGYFSDAAYMGTLKAMRAMGFKGQDVTDLSSIHGGKCIVVIEHEPDLNGNPRDRVKWVNALNTPMMKSQMNTAQTATFASKMKARIAAAKEELAEIPQPDKAEDDLPF
jgi:hypothetical protein